MAIGLQGPFLQQKKRGTWNSHFFHGRFEANLYLGHGWSIIFIHLNLLVWTSRSSWFKHNETRSWIRGEFATLLARSSSRALPKVRAGPRCGGWGLGVKGWRKHPIRCVFPWESDQFQWYSCAGKLFCWFDASKHLEMFMSSVRFSCQNWFKPFPSLVPFGKGFKPFPVFPSKDSPFPIHFPVFSWLFNFIFGKEMG